MTSDIVEQLRAWAEPISSGYEVPRAAVTLYEAADEIESLRSRLAETTGQLDAANKHVEILQRSAVENYAVWCEQMGVLRSRLAFAESVIHRVLCQGWVCGGDGCSGCPACYDFDGATKEDER
jgi:hypothetical protein